MAEGASTPIDDGTPMNLFTDGVLRPPSPAHDAESPENGSVSPMDQNASLESNDDDTDAFPKFVRPSRSANLNASPPEKKLESAEAVLWSATDHYDLSYPSMGKFVIVSNKTFEPKTGMGERNGTDVDAQALYLRFKELGFDVSVHTNLNARAILKLFQTMAAFDHSDCATFGCAILSHGEDGVIYGTDRQLEIDQITKPFRGDRCSSLVGKPKMFFIQACRGTDLMEGVDLHKADANTEISERLPVESDFLIAYSVVPGYFSWRNSMRGSWFVQALCECLDQYGKSMDLLKLLTRVNKKVALNFESNTSNKDMHKKKQIPCITSMMTKDLYLDTKAVNDGIP